jgi:hypothetical protein
MTRSALIGFLLLALLGAPRPARAHDDAAPPKRLGTVAFANSCAPEAQESFERGVALLHSFAFIAGEQAFREALAHDPACAIATWGIATVLVGNTFAIGPIAEEAQRAFAAIERGRAMGAKTERERDYQQPATQPSRFTTTAVGPPACGLRFGLGANENTICYDRPIHT